MQTTKLNEGIANFYDESSGLWESMWGEHMHHGKGIIHKLAYTFNPRLETFGSCIAAHYMYASMSQAITPKADLPRAIRKLK